MTSVGVILIVTAWTAALLHQLRRIQARRPHASQPRVDDGLNAPRHHDQS